MNGNQSSSKCYISLDLGSESTSAYYEIVGAAEGQIDLQQHAGMLIKAEYPSLSMPIIDYLMDGGERSKRLRTRFSIEPDRQPATLPDAHAELDLVGNSGTGYASSLFRYFMAEGTGRQPKILPNPKIPFQYGAKGIIPKVKPTGGGAEVEHPPETLVQHIVTHIVNNFILKSEELKRLRTKSEDIHLILTVPNVYSLTHAQSIRNFVSKHTGIKEVETLYESDAVAYFAMTDPHANDPKEIRKFKDVIDEIIGELKVPIRIVTIDVGRGTTDLSLIQIKRSKDEKGETIDEHSVLARIGKSDGGNRLSYIFADYYNERLKEAFDRFRDGVGSDLKFDFLSGDMTVYQAYMLEELVKLIENVKRKIDEEYVLSLSRDEQIAMLDPVINNLFDGLDANWKSKGDTYEELRRELHEAMLLEQKFPGWLRDRWQNSWIGKLFTKPSPRSIRLENMAKLRKGIEKYVGENIDSLIDEIDKMAMAREMAEAKKEKRRRRKVFDEKCTIVFVAGQASGFGPIRKTIREKFGDLPKEQICFAPGLLAKESCCVGAVAFKKAGSTKVNYEEIHGTYGFLDGKRFKPLDMSKINSEEKDEVVFYAPPTKYHLFIYSPRHYPAQSNSSDYRAPVRGDGATAVVKAFQGNKFEVRYDKQASCIMVNGDPITGVATYGQVEEDIYPKVWPEIVKPFKK